jgi:hypothetical protein
MSPEPAKTLILQDATVGAAPWCFLCYPNMLLRPKV